MSETEDRIEQITQEVRRDLEFRHGYFATLSPEFEQRVAAEVERRVSTASFPEAWRCRTCRWWTGERDVTDSSRLAVSGECRRHLDGDAPEPFWTEPPLAEDSERGWSKIYTVRGHGCIEWEAKE